MDWDSTDLHFKYVQKLTDRESFLEKEMLEAEVHYFESRTAFFDKLTVLAAGTLAVAIPFLAAAFQSPSLRAAINVNLTFLSAALIATGISLICCILHNLGISRAVRFLSEQIEWTYKAAHRLLEFGETDPSSNILTLLPVEVSSNIKGLESRSASCDQRKRSAMKFAERTSIPALLFLIVSYGLGICAVVSIMNYSGISHLQQSQDQSAAPLAIPPTKNPPSSSTTDMPVTHTPSTLLSMTFGKEVLSGCLGSICAGLFFVFWYAVFQRLLQATDIRVGYNWSWKVTDFHPNFDIRNHSKSRTYLLANIAYTKKGMKAPIWIDNKSLWGIEMKPGSINHFDAVAPVRDVHSMEDCTQVQVKVRVQTGREFPGTGPGQDIKQAISRGQRIAYWIRDFFDKNAIPME